MHKLNFDLCFTWMHIAHTLITYIKETRLLNSEVKYYGGMVSCWRWQTFSLDVIGQIKHISTIYHLMNSSEVDCPVLRSPALCLVFGLGLWLVPLPVNSSVPCMHVVFIFISYVVQLRMLVFWSLCLWFWCRLAGSAFCAVFYMHIFSYFGHLPPYSPYWVLTVQHLNICRNLHLQELDN